MLADVLTKVLPGSYLRMCMTGCRWTLGPDDRAPSTRGRKLQVPDRVQTAQEADKMNDMLRKFLENENNDLENAPDHHDVTEISTQLTDIYFNDSEIFCGYTDFGSYSSCSASPRIMPTWFCVILAIVVALSAHYFENYPYKLSDIVIYEIKVYHLIMIIFILSMLKKTPISV